MNKIMHLAFCFLHTKLESMATSFKVIEPNKLNQESDEILITCVL